MAAAPESLPASLTHLHLGGNRIQEVSAAELRNASGVLVETRDWRKAPRPFPEEIQEAFSMVYADAALGSRADEPEPGAGATTMGRADT